MGFQNDFHNYSTGPFKQLTFEWLKLWDPGQRTLILMNKGVAIHGLEHVHLHDRLNDCLNTQNSHCQFWSSSSKLLGDRSSNKPRWINTEKKIVL